MNQIIIKYFMIIWIYLIFENFPNQKIDFIQKVLAICDDVEWDCDDGQCIPGENRCDGTVHCSDGSDETVLGCIQNYRDCQLTAFTAFSCSYGACVTGYDRCNGRQDCADNSDELFCGSEAPGLIKGDCNNHSRKCQSSGECIDLFSLCDGHVDCKDGSDETLEVCAGVVCPHKSFRCGYGACISGHAQCNGTRECIDGSDEAWELCGYSRIRQVPTQISSSPNKFPNRPSVKKTSNVSRYINHKSCQLPENLLYLEAKLHPTNITLMPGSWVEDYSLVYLQCLNNHLLLGPQDLICKDGYWEANFPTCAKYCQPPLGLSTLHFCYNDGRDTCRRIPPGSEVFIKCAPGYINSAKPYHSQTIFCNLDGTFEEERLQCVMNCGQSPMPNTALILNGFTTLQMQVPWQVAIYQKADGKNYKYICAGSIVSPSVIITAAHCFWDAANQLVNEPELYEVAAGKYYRNYTVDGDPTAQKRTISKIAVYNGYNNENFQWDIALLRLSSPLKFSANISAVCIQLNLFNGAADYIPDDRAGLVAGWGEDGSLKQVAMKTRSHDQCLRQLGRRRKLAEDKFCIKNDRAGSLCRGDSGSGFVVYDEYMQRYHLWGVVSYAPYQIDECARDGLVAISNINHMHPDLQNALQDYQQQDIKLF